MVPSDASLELFFAAAVQGAASCDHLLPGLGSAVDERLRSALTQFEVLSNASPGGQTPGDATMQPVTGGNASNPS